MRSDVLEQRRRARLLSPDDNEVKAVLHFAHTPRHSSYFYLAAHVTHRLPNVWRRRSPPRGIPESHWLTTHTRLPFFHAPEMTPLSMLASARCGLARIDWSSTRSTSTHARRAWQV